MRQCWWPHYLDNSCPPPGGGPLRCWFRNNHKPSLFYRVITLNGLYSMPLLIYLSLVLLYRVSGLQFRQWKLLVARTIRRSTRSFFISSDRRLITHAARTLLMLGRRHWWNYEERTSLPASKARLRQSRAESWPTSVETRRCPLQLARCIPWFHSFRFQFYRLTYEYKWHII